MSRPVVGRDRRTIDVQALAALAIAGAAPVRSPDRERLLASAVRPGWRAWTDRVASLWDLAPSQVEVEFRRSESRARWARSPVPGVEAFHLEGGPATTGADVGLVRIPAGLRFPWHSHDETEEYVVLQGVMRFADGHSEHPGDRVRHDSSVTHAYHADGDVVVAIVMRGLLTPR